MLAHNFKSTIKKDVEYTIKNCFSQNNTNDNYLFNLSYVQRKICNIQFIYYIPTYIIFNRYEFVFRQLTNQAPL